MEWVRAREARSLMAVMASVIPRRQERTHLPILYPRWRVRPKEQLVRFNSWIDPICEIPTMSI
jgi:hypothetical protein